MDSGTALYYAVPTLDEVWMHMSVVMQRQGLSWYSSKITELVPGMRIKQLVPNHVAHNGTSLLVVKNDVVAMAHMNKEIN